MRVRYARALCAIAILIMVNVLPGVLGASTTPKLELSLIPQSPFNYFYPESDTTITLCIRNLGDTAAEVEVRLIRMPPNVILNGRDGIGLPLRVTVRENSVFFHSLALIALENARDGDICFEMVGDNNNVLDRRSLSMRRLSPRLTPKELISKVMERGFSGDVSMFCIPKYRRYWHPELNEMGEAIAGYVWLIVTPQGNFLIDDNRGEILEENLILPWQVEAVEYGEARVWCGSGFENMRVPTVRIMGDASFDFNRFELYYARFEDSPVWIVRQLFYWAYGGGIEEIPDTERIELWISAENGEKLFTISDYHHHAFRYDPVEAYTILAYFHCPLAEDLPQSWFDFLLAEYENVYPASKIQYDHMGFLPVHPLIRATREYEPLIRRNLLGVGIISVLYIFPKIRRRSGKKDQEAMRIIASKK
jgi:hypothetical protein